MTLSTKCFSCLAIKRDLIIFIYQVRLSDLDLLGPKFLWVLVNDGSLDIAAIKSLLKEGDNVAIISPHSYTDDEVQKVVRYLKDNMT